MIRIPADEYEPETVLWPALRRFLPLSPDVTVEVVVDYGLFDIVAERYDAGVRLGDAVAKDMIAVPISADQRMIVVAAPAYLATVAAPEHPQEQVDHRCINLRLPTPGGLYVWEFQKDGRELSVRVKGPMICKSLGLMVEAAFGGLGFAYLPEGKVRRYIERGKLRAVLEDSSPAYPGFRLFDPSRRQPSAALALLVEALRFRA